jgi:hypothetical protein
MRLPVSIIALLITTPLLRAQVVVTNPISDALGEIQHVEDIAKAAEMINNQIQQINTLTQQLHQIQAYVKAFGDPEQLLSIAGADELISSLEQTGVGKTVGELQQLANGVEALQYNANGLYTSLSETFTTPSGIELPRAENLYRKYGAIQQSSRNFQDVTDDVKARREALRNQIATTTQQLQAATTDAETQKLTGVLVGYTAELEAVEGEIDHAAAQVATQDAENRADRDRQEQARREERQAEMEQSFLRYGEVFRLETTPPALPTRN